MNGPWVEKYRPQSLDDIVGQKHVTDRLKKYIGSDDGMPNLMFTGPAGVGKTTVALALVKSAIGEYWRSNFLELNASDSRRIDDVRHKIKDFCRLKPFAAPFKIVFLDEADSMTKDAQHALRREMEMYTKTVVFILSCNYSSKIIDPIQSRCAIFRFNPIKGQEIINRLKIIANEEKVDYDDSAIESIVYFAEGDMRKAINILQASASVGDKINDDNIHEVISKARPEDVSNMITKALTGDFIGARDILREIMILQGTSGEDLVNQIYQDVSRRVMEEIMDSKIYINLIEGIADTDFRIREGANPRIQLEAMLTKFL
ncbi:MAG: replication factor C small subunit [Methanobrevibacter sp.]|jgi:replication factor C small subunit|nr:replication factor C small subunit [Candidatus Methanovirga meridionalis]